MPAVKSRTSLWSAQTLTASSGNTTSSTINLTATYTSQVNIKITNGGTGPTIPAQCQVVVGNDSAPTLATNFGGALIASNANSAITYFSVEIPPGIEAIYLVAGSNTGQNVTIDADISSVTSV
jgi:hypothetical protein